MVIAYILGGAAVVALHLYVMYLIHKYSSMIIGRMDDCARANKTKFTFGLVLLSLLVGIPLAVSGLMFWPGIVMIVLPFVVLFAFHRQHFWKIYILKLIAFPFYTMQFILGFFVARDRTKAGGTSERYNSFTNTLTTTYYSGYDDKFPDHIEQDGYSLDVHPYLYRYYDNCDGTRCIVSRGVFNTDSFTITPLYNIHDPLPKWIAWLYKDPNAYKKSE